MFGANVSDTYLHTLRERREDEALRQRQELPVRPVRDLGSVRYGPPLYPAYHEAFQDRDIFTYDDATAARHGWPPGGRVQYRHGWDVLPAEGR